ncbi:MAG: winged helix-turn-helix domain-containing protein [Sphingomonas sp.]
MVGGGTHQSQPNEVGDRRAPIVLAYEQSFRIGEAEILPATREVRFAGQAFVLEPRVMQLLIALHRAEGAVVNKDDLLQSCWEGRIVGEDAINRVVSRLRGVAQKEAGQQFRIETITKVGYRLLSANGETLDAGTHGPSAGRVARRQTAFAPPHPMAIAVAALLVLVSAAGSWWWFRPVPTPAHSMMVRLSGFQTLSPDLPGTMRETINAEITSAFNVDGVIGVSTMPMPTPGRAPAYSLGGTIYRVGNTIRVITRFTNEQSGVVLWSDTVDYAADNLSKVPHKIAVDAGTVIRCGLSGAATYRKALPDRVLSNYMQYCREYWSYGGSKTLRFAQLVVAAVPDFSWGWSAVGNGFMQAADVERDYQRADALRAAGRQAEDKALALDRNNSEALAHKAYLIDPSDWAGQEMLFKRAIAAKPLDCGCEHYGYGLKLESVGRLGAAIEQFRAATDMLALWSDSQLALARTLVSTDRSEQARPYFAAAIELSKDPSFDKMVAVTEGTETGDYTAALTALRSPQLRIPDKSRVALLLGYEALVSRTPQAKIKAVQELVALPKHEESETIALMLAALNANAEAIQVAAQRPWLFWRRSMRGVLSEPTFPTIAQQLGLIAYWKASRTKPDVCLATGAPPFCRMI